MRLESFQISSLEVTSDAFVKLDRSPLSNVVGRRCHIFELVLSSGLTDDIGLLETVLPAIDIWTASVEFLHFCCRFILIDRILFVDKPSQSRSHVLQVELVFVHGVEEREATATDYIVLGHNHAKFVSDHLREFLGDFFARSYRLGVCEARRLSHDVLIANEAFVGRLGHVHGLSNHSGLC